MAVEDLETRTAGDGREQLVHVASRSYSDGVYWFLRGVVHLTCRLYLDVKVTRRTEIPKQGPVILAPVHRSLIDFLVVSEVTSRKFYYMAKDDLWKRPRFGRFLESVGAFPVNREGTDRLALDRAQHVLDRGDALFMFPEGTRRTGSAVEDIHEGAAFLAARSGASIYPIGISGSAKAMPKGKKMLRPAKIRLVVGEPIAPPARTEKGRVPRNALRRTTEELRAAMEELVLAADSEAGNR